MEVLFAQAQHLIYFRATLISLLVLPVLVASTSIADGSKDLIKNGGSRPFLEAGTGRTIAGIDRLNRFFVYTRSGETLQLGSSAFGVYEGDILFTRPDGTSGSCLALKPQGAVAGWGVIRSVDEEKAGPLPSAGGYTPCTPSAEGSGQGVWEIVFLGPAPESWQYSDPLPAGAAWTQAPDVYTIAAWDITVRAEIGQIVPGRVFTTYLPVNMGGASETLASEFFVLTKDGYQYRIDANRAAGHTLLLFANTSGFQGSAHLEPLYGSVALDELNTANNGFPDGVTLHDPAAPDAEDAVTHKLFFTRPNADLPAAAMHGTETIWLVNPASQPAVLENLSFSGSAGMNGSFSFDASGAGRYLLTVDLNQNGVWGDGVDVFLAGTTLPGNNIVSWNGLDAGGNLVPGSELGYNARVIALAGEIHLPMIDLENQSLGVIVERLDGSGSPDFKVYYNDAAFSTREGRPEPLNASGGMDSRAGVHAFTANFGDAAGIDTWTYVGSEPAYLDTPLFRSTSDLRLSIDLESRAPPADVPFSAAILIDNDGPDDAYGIRVKLALPAGISMQQSNAQSGSFAATDNIWYIEALPAGAGARLDLTLMAPAKGAFPLFAEIIEHRGLDPDSKPNNFDERIPGEGAEDDTAEAFVYVDPAPSIGIAERIVSFSGDLAGFTAEFEILIENLGNTSLSGIQVTDNLIDRFHGTDFWVVDVRTIAPLTKNPAFDGDLDTHLLNAAQSELAVGEQATISYTVAVTPFGNLGPYSGNAYVSAESIDGTHVEDISDDGLTTDENKDGAADGAGENDPSVITVSHNPAIGLAMAVRNVLGSASSFSADYTIVVENLGNVPLSNVQVINDISGTLGPGAITVTGLSAGAPLIANPDFDGLNVDNMLDASTSKLGIGGKATITFHLQASPSFSIGFFNQVARVTALGPDGASISDLSDNGLEPDTNGNGKANDSGEDDVTVVSFGDPAALGVSLFAPRVTGDLGGFSISYDLKIENLGDVVLSGIQVLEDLAGVFEGTTFSVSDLAATQPLQINQNFNGVTDKNLLLSAGSSLAPQASANITFTVDAIPRDNYGPYRNSAVAYADTPSGTPVTDNSDSGTVIDPDNDGNANEPGENDPTVTGFAPTGYLGAALGIAGITGDLNEFKVNYTVVGENLGDVPLSALSLSQDLATMLTGVHFEVLSVAVEPPYVANPLFDGKNYKELLAPSSEVLNTGERTSVEVELAVVPVSNFGPFPLSSSITAETPFGTRLLDTSASGLDPDPNHNGNPTEASENTASVVSLDERPVIGVSLAAASVQGDMKEFTVKYVLRLENLGDVPLQQLNATSDLAETFQGADFEVIRTSVRGSLALNPGFDGSEDVGLLNAASSSLSPGDSARIELDVHVLPVSEFGPYFHSITASATGPNGTNTVDVSNDGYDPDANGNGVPNEENENEPTAISVGVRPAVGIAKALTGIREKGDGFEATFDLTLRNTGNVPLTDVQIVEDLAAAFSGSAVEVLAVDVSGDRTPNANFDGITDKQLLGGGSPSLAPGEDVAASYVLAVSPSGNATRFETQAVAKAKDPGGNEVVDLSNDGMDPDPNGNGNSSESGEDTPTFVEPALFPYLYLHAQVDDVSGDSTRFEVQYSLLYKNDGAVLLDSLNLSLNLADVFPGASLQVLDVRAVSGEELPINPEYDGRSFANIFGPRGLTLAPDHSDRLKVRVEVVPGAGFGPYEGRVRAAGVTGKGQVVFDVVQLPPVRLVTSTGEEAGLESNGDLSTLVSVRNYRRRHAGQLAGASKRADSPLLLMAGASAVEGTGSLTNQAVLDLIPADGPEGAEGIVTTPGDLFGITNATSILAVDYIARDARIAALFTTTTPAGELYDHTKNICDRLKGASLEAVELVSIKGHPFVLSILEHDNGDIDYAISFIGYKNGLSYLVDSRFVRESYQTRVGVLGEILNFQVWSYNPAYTIALVEEIIDRMEEAGGVGFVSKEDDIPRVPGDFVQRGHYEGGQLILQIRKTPGISEYKFEGKISSVEGGEKSSFERVVPVPGTASDDEEIVLLLPSGMLFDALLTVTNDANDNTDQIYVADGSWGKMEDQQDKTVIESFEVLEQEGYEPGNDDYVVERGAVLKGTVAEEVILFRHFRPGGKPVDLSGYSYVQFTASGTGAVKVRLEESTESEDFFTKQIELTTTPKKQTIFLDEFSKQNGQSGFKGNTISALSFLFEGNAASPRDIAIRVEDIIFGKGTPTHNTDDPLIPEVYSLSQNYPNPFNPKTTIEFGLPEPAEVTLQLFDMLGRQMMTLARQDYEAGRHKVVLDAGPLASGAYIYRLVANEEVFTKVMHLVK